MTRDPSGIHVAGPLAEHASGLAAELDRQGYAKASAVDAMRFAAELSRWLEQHAIQLSDLDDCRVAKFMEDRRKRGRRRARGATAVMDHLRQLGLRPERGTPTVATRSAHLVEEFARYLANERGLAGGTVHNHARVAAAFLSTRGELQDSILSQLTAADVSVFVLEESAGRSAGALGNVVTGLRALLRFLYLKSYTPVPLAAAVLGPPGWRRASLPRGLGASQVARLLEFTDRSTAVGRRDFAILLILVRLGLRAGEVASLTLDDVNWRAGEILIAGKGNRRECMPLPIDVGQALVDYCRRGRRSNEHRFVFLQARAPYRGLSTSAITAAVYSACTRAGLPRVGAHQLRHTAATEMRRVGVPLADIAQVLRHRQILTTTIYARDDVDALRDVVAPWPGGQA